MNTFKKSFVAAGCSVASLFTNAPETVANADVPEMVRVILPASMPKDDPQVQRIVDYSMVKLPHGQELYLYDGWNLRKICSLKLPEGVDEDSIPARRNALRRSLSEFGAWLESNRSGSYDFALKIPEAIRELSPLMSNGEMVLVYGDCKYPVSPYEFVTEDEGSPVYRMPNDAHIAARGNPFSVLETDAPKGVKMHILLPKREMFANLDHKTNIRRWYGLWSQYRFEGGGLCSFGYDAESVFDELGNAKTQPAFYEISRKHGRKPKMVQADVQFDPKWADFRRLKPHADPRSFQKKEAGDVGAGRGNTSEMAKSIIESLSVDTSKGEASIAIGWSASCDLDLVVYPEEGAQPLYYGNLSSERYGRYLKDQRTPKKYEYEEVVLNSAFEGASAWINLHAANRKLSEAPSGEYYITVDNVVYVGSFSFAVRRGNKGRDLDKRHSSPFWVKLDLSKLKPLEASETKEAIH